jgi:hypothetical protein
MTVDLPPDELVDDPAQVITSGVRADLDHDRLPRQIAQFPKTSNEAVLPAGLGLLVRQPHVTDRRGLLRRLRVERQYGNAGDDRSEHDADAKPDHIPANISPF